MTEEPTENMLSPESSKMIANSKEQVQLGEGKEPMTKQHALPAFSRNQNLAEYQAIAIQTIHMY